MVVYLCIACKLWRAWQWASG